MDENEKALLRQIDAFIERNRENIVRDMKTLVDINSVQGEPAPGAPFGPGPKRALDAALHIAAEMGLATHDCEGYVGYADLAGESEAHIALMTHLDVVPEGNGWTSDPFCMTLRDGFAVGRGTADDKGPAVITLYAAKFFKERGEVLPYTLRILLGTNEETGMQDMEYYLAHYPQPAFGFSPDARFPVGYAEKGGYSGWLESAPLQQGNLLEFYGGEAKNVVPDRAYALVRTERSDLPDTERITVHTENGTARIEARGKGGHVAGPQGSVNAIGLVVAYLLQNGLCTAQEQRALGMLHTLHADTDGSALGVAARDDVFGPLTCVGGMVRLEQDRLRQSVDIRYPATMDDARLSAALHALAENAGGRFEQGAMRPPFCIDPNSPEIRTLTDTYNELANRSDAPFTMGGGTYARRFANAISYGPGELDQFRPAWAGSPHGADEAMGMEQLYKALRIYLLAISRLMKLQLPKTAAHP